jgi:DNA topoisomerase VI subunit B
MMSAPAPRLRRETFKTSRLSEFCSERELIALTGHGVESWPAVIMKELVDNSIDVTEEAGIAPVIKIEVSTARGEIIVSDNGPGIETEVVTSILDLTARTSSRALYVSPTRGQQGNALSTVLAMGFVLDGARGETVIEAKGKAHQIVFTIDPIVGEPRIACDLSASSVKTGTRITVRWPTKACPIISAARDRFLQIAVGYAAFNPHVMVLLDWDGDCGRAKATVPDWRKWLPSDPIPAHWLDETRFEPYVAAGIRRDQEQGLDRPLRQFVAEFRGLTGSGKQKAILEELGASRLTLSQFFADGAGNVNHAAVAKLLRLMQRESRPPKAHDLGIIGRDHMLARCLVYGADPGSFRYAKRIDESDIAPYVVEAAFAWHPDADGRTIVSGVNFSPAIGNPFQRLGWQSLRDLLAAQSAGFKQPVILQLHYVCPHVLFADRGKSALTLLPSHADAIVETVTTVTAAWNKKHQATERAERRDDERLRREYKARQQDRERAARYEEQKATADVVGTGILHQVIAEAAQAEGSSLNSLTVLSRDPYRQDTHIGHLRAGWFKAQIERFVPAGKQVHLRKLHYVVSSVNDIIKPDDKRLYVNSYKHWQWLQNYAAKAARWLQYVPFNYIEDNRNDPPESYVQLNQSAPHAGIGYGSEADVFIPVLSALHPRASCGGLAGQQPYRIVLFGEKSSLREDLEPIAREIGAELLLPTGEISDTLIAELAARAAADPRPTIVLYVADFDPAGFQMPVSVGRKLQALRDLLYPGLRIEVHRVALTLEQCNLFDLPSTPLKESELRADKWRARFGREQTEIDALMALHPGALRQIVLEAAAPFWASMLTTRAVNAEIAWQDEVNIRLAEHPAYAKALAGIEKARDGVAEAAHKIQRAQNRMMAKLSEVERPPVPEVIEPAIGAKAPAPIFSSGDDFVTATLKLIADKRGTETEDDDDDADSEA